jgi:hypothetical protein
MTLGIVYKRECVQAAKLCDQEGYCSGLYNHRVKCKSVICIHTCRSEVRVYARIHVFNAIVYLDIFLSACQTEWMMAKGHNVRSQLFPHFHDANQ